MAVDPAGPQLDLAAGVRGAHPDPSGSAWRDLVADFAPLIRIIRRRTRLGMPHGAIAPTLPRPRGALLDDG
jgi:hypothetical protein